MKFTFPPESKPLAGYTLKRGIHRGAFGEVYYAHTEAGKEVALKLLQSQMEVELRGVRQCLNLKHPNLVGLYDIRVDDDGDHWIVMEYVAGRSLAEVLEDHPDGLPPDEVAEWIAGMAAGLDFLHDRGIVHRDLKPANVFMEDGVVKIGDVGLSKYISQSRRNEQTQSVGTVYYMAPEVAHGRYGQEVDVYSLGIVFYELLTGRVPFDGESTGEILMKHLTDEPDLTAVAEPFREVIARALAKDPTQRTPSTAALAKEAQLAFRRAGAVLVGSAAGTPALPTDRLDRLGHATAPLGPPELPEPPSRADSNDAPAPEDAVPDSEVAVVSDSSFRPWTWFREQWDGPHANWVRWGTATAVVVLFASGAGFALLPVVACVAAVKYGTDWVVNGLRNRQDREPQAVAATSPPPPPVPLEPPKPRHLESPRRKSCARVAKSGEWLTPETTRAIPWRQRFAELVSSLAYAGPLTALVTTCLVLVVPYLADGRASAYPLDPASIGLFGGITLLGSWSILAAAKFGEGRERNGLYRRIAFFAVGVMVGSAAFWLHRELLVTMTDHVFRSSGAWPNTLSLKKYALFFGALFALRRWWWHVDGYRENRFRVMSVLWTGFVALLLTGVLDFPSLWGVLWAASISSVVQLASAWMPPDVRYEGGEPSRA